MTKHTLLKSGVLACGVFFFAGLATGWAAELNFECTTNGAGNWHIKAEGPKAVACQPSSAADLCTEMDYTITPLKGLSPDHVAILVDHEFVVENTDDYSNRGVFLDCTGDSVTQIGIRDCSRNAVRMNENSDTKAYSLSVVGDAAPQASSIVVKKGKVIEECRIASLGPTTCDPKAQQASKETFAFDGCEVEITLDPCTNKPLSSKVISGDCAVGKVEIQSLELVINGVSQPVTVGDGWLSSGENSCTTRWFNRQPYVTCSCTNASDCLVQTADGSYLCSGKGICPVMP
jgi:hypothetical protein